MMKLFGHDTSPYVRRVRVLLSELAVPFERDTMSWVAPTEEFQRLNPIQRVPALLDEGQAILDSKLIAAYVYDRPATAVPAPPPGHAPIQATLWHPAHRYADENFVLTLDAAVDSAINVFLLEQDGILPAAAPYLQRQVRRIGTCLEWLDQQLRDRDTLHDGVFSFADVSLMCALEWLTFRKRHDVSQHEHLHRFVSRHQARPALAATHPRHAAPSPPPRAR